MTELNRRAFLRTAGATIGLSTLAGCGGKSDDWWAVLQAVWEKEPVLANASVYRDRSLLTPTVALNPSMGICDTTEDSRHFIITVTDDDVESWVSYRHPCTPDRKPPTVEVGGGVYRVLVNSGAAGADPLAEYELQVSNTTEYRSVDGGSE